MTSNMAKVTFPITVEIINYPGALQSAVYGMSEFLQLANSEEVLFDVNITEPESISANYASIVVLPPNMSGDYYILPQDKLLVHLNNSHKNGAILCSVCAGAFILAATGLLNQRTITTHWQLKSLFLESFNDVDVDTDRIVIDDFDIVTAGGLMSWMDLTFALISRFAGEEQTRALGKFLVIDTGIREQKYYQTFNPDLQHGFEKIADTQKFIHQHYADKFSIDCLAESIFLTRRTFIRHFKQATGLNPTDYIQRIRIQRACEFLENSNVPVEKISCDVGYEDVNSFRKIFMRIIGLTPKAFRARFSLKQTATAHD